MNKYIEKYNFKITTLTPIHITDGYDTDIIPVDYVIDAESKILYRIDLSKVNFDSEDRKLLNAAIEKNDLIEIRNFLQEIWKNKKQIFEQSRCYSMNSEDVFNLHQNLQKEDHRLQLILNTFIRNNNTKFLPGSSVKGAIRTALIENTIKDEDYPLDSQSNKEAIKLEAKTLAYWTDNKADVTKDPLKSLKISDANISTNGIVKKIEIFKKEKEKRFTTLDGMKIFKEILPINSVMNSEVSLDKRYFTYKERIGKPFDFNKIIESCRKFYTKVLDHEQKNFFNEFDSNVKQSGISVLYDGIKKINNSENCFVLRLGSGSGRNSISFNIRNKKGINPVTRKLIKINDLYLPLGWVKVEF